MKNKLQQKICAIFQRTIQPILHIFSKLCVSLKRDNTTEKELCEKEKCGKFEKFVEYLIRLFPKHIQMEKRTIKTQLIE